VQVRVVHQVLAPTVQDRQEADLRPKMGGIGGDGAQRLRRSPEQDVVDHRLVLERDGGDLVRQREDHMEVRHGQQLGPAVLEPLCAGERLALGAVSVTTRVVRDGLMAAAVTPLDVTAERGGAAAFDRAHGTPLCGRQRRTMALAIAITVAAEDIRHFGPLAAHAVGSSGGDEIRCRGSDAVQRIQWAGCGADLAGGNAQIPRHRGETAMAEQS
jgi:hypothetical protein